MNKHLNRKTKIKKQIIRNHLNITQNIMMLSNHIMNHFP